MDPPTMVLGDRELGGRENVVTIQCMENHNKMTTKQECTPVGCVPPARRPYLPGAGGVPGRGGVPGPRGVVCTWSRGGTWSGTPPPVNRITHTCKNITLPQLRCGR